jgi:predicted Rossmann fold flavoprotein
LKTVHVYGAGPAGLMAADVLVGAGVKVELHDHMRLPARKFLLAGRGGLNLTNTEPLDVWGEHFGNGWERLLPSLKAFPPSAVTAWCASMGIETFVGSSGRVFPKVMKSSPLLRAWVQRLQQQGITYHPESPWPGFTGQPTILAFGGASWPELGSDAKWISHFTAAGINVNPFVASNARHDVAWSQHFISKFAGTPLKNIALSHDGKSVAGEVVVTEQGLEGGAIYALSQSIRKNPGAPLLLDLRPALSQEQVLAKMLTTRKGDSRANILRKAFKLPPVAIGLMRETQALSVKRLELRTTGAHDLRRAISSAGGVDWDEINEDLSLKKQPNTHVAGEMMDWDAPTGGYLLQTCFATGHFAATQLLKRL